MKKTEFLERLGQELEKRNVADPADIVEEYEQHWADSSPPCPTGAGPCWPWPLRPWRCWRRWAACITGRFCASWCGPMDGFAIMPWRWLPAGGTTGPGHQPAVFRQDQAPSANGGPGGPGAVRRMLRAFLCGVRPVGGQLPVLACVGLVCEVR